MLKNDLYKMVREKVAKKLENVTIKDTGIFVDATIDAIKDAVAAGEKVSFIGFGSFEAVDRAAREVRNPKTGEILQVPSSKSPKFRPSKTFKEAVNA